MSARKSMAGTFNIFDLLLDTFEEVTGEAALYESQPDPTAIPLEQPPMPLPARNPPMAQPLATRSPFGSSQSSLSLGASWSANFLPGNVASSIASLSPTAAKYPSPYPATLASADQSWAQHHQHHHHHHHHHHHQRQQQQLPGRCVASACITTNPKLPPRQQSVLQPQLIPVARTASDFGRPFGSDPSPPLAAASPHSLRPSNLPSPFARVTGLDYRPDCQRHHGQSCCPSDANPVTPQAQSQSQSQSHRQPRCSRPLVEVGPFDGRNGSEPRGTGGPAALTLRPVACDALTVAQQRQQRRSSDVSAFGPLWPEGPWLAAPTEAAVSLLAAPPATATGEPLPPSLLVVPSPTLSAPTTMAVVDAAPLVIPSPSLRTRELASRLVAVPPPVTTGTQPMNRRRSDVAYTATPGSATCAVTTTALCNSPALPYRPAAAAAGAARLALAAAAFSLAPSQRAWPSAAAAVPPSRRPVPSTALCTSPALPYYATAATAAEAVFAAAGASGPNPSPGPPEPAFMVAQPPGSGGTAVSPAAEGLVPAAGRRFALPASTAAAAAALRVPGVFPIRFSGVSLPASPSVTPPAGGYAIGSSLAFAVSASPGVAPLPVHGSIPVPQMAPGPASGAAPPAEVATVQFRGRVLAPGRYALGPLPGSAVVRPGAPPEQPQLEPSLQQPHRTQRPPRPPLQAGLSGRKRPPMPPQAVMAAMMAAPPSVAAVPPSGPPLPGNGPGGKRRCI